MEEEEDGKGGGGCGCGNEESEPEITKGVEGEVERGDSSSGVGGGRSQRGG